MSKRLGVGTLIGSEDKNSLLFLSDVPYLYTYIHSGYARLSTARKLCYILQCVCVCFLPIHSGHQVRWTYQPGSHRRKVTQDF